MVHHGTTPQQVLRQTLPQQLLRQTLCRNSCFARHCAATAALPGTVLQQLLFQALCCNSCFARHCAATAALPGTVLQQLLRKASMPQQLARCAGSWPSSPANRETLHRVERIHKLQTPNARSADIH
eukprot:363354-Chlamydomonas_euryale.AAC.2